MSIYIIYIYIYIWRILQIPDVSFGVAQFQISTGLEVAGLCNRQEAGS